MASLRMAKMVQTTVAAIALSLLVLLGTSAQQVAAHLHFSNQAPPRTLPRGQPMFLRDCTGREQEFLPKDLTASQPAALLFLDADSTMTL